MKTSSTLNFNLKKTKVPPDLLMRSGVIYITTDPLEKVLERAHNFSLFEEDLFHVTRIRSGAQFVYFILRGSLKDYKLGSTENLLVTFNGVKK